MFRVVAINKCGPSPPSDESDSLTLRKEVIQEAPVIQKQLTNTTIARKTTMTLSCIVGGVPEPDIKWFHNETVVSSSNTTYSNRVAKLVTECTTEETAGAYKCIATNVCGFAESTCTVTIAEEPTIVVDDIQLSQKLRIDEQYEVMATVNGYPRPKVVWYKSKTKLEAKANTKMSYEESHAQLIISKLKRVHTGKYVIEATNDHGTARRDLILTIIDKPSAPEGPLVVSTLKKDTARLEWKPPRDCGGLDLTHYIVEKCSPGDNSWIKVAEVDSHLLTYDVHKLKPNSQYRFRVIACNTIGESDPLESDVAIMRMNAETPSPPRGPIEVSGMTQDSFVISWKESESDGGSPIIEYLVEIKQSTEKEWKSYGSTTPDVMYLIINQLKHSTGYDIRIRARNMVGDSAYLESVESIVSGRQPSKYNIIIII